MRLVLMQVHRHRSLRAAMPAKFASVRCAVAIGSFFF